MKIMITGLVLAAAFAAAPSQAMPEGYEIEGDPVKGRTVAEEHCQDCHGINGVGTDPSRPNLARQKPVYLVAQLRALRDSAWDKGVTKRSGRRHGTMGDNIILYSDEQIGNLAAFYSGLSCPPPEAAPTPRPPVANRCQMCHGPNGVSNIAAVPNLASQKAEYIAAQLRRFRTTGHDEFTEESPESRSNPVMDTQAKKLTDAQITAVATWFAGQGCR